MCNFANRKQAMSRKAIPLNHPMSRMWRSRWTALPVLLSTILFLFLNSSPARAQQPCRIALIPESDNMCVLEVGNNYAIIRACRGNTVCYTVYTDVLPVPSYSWEVEGGTFQLNFSHEECCVTWGDGASGRVKVTATCQDGSVDSKELQVELMDRPTARLSSVPNYIPDFNDPSVKTIHVCEGDSLTFTDISISGETPISSYYWDGPGGVSTSGTYSFAATTMGTYTVTHRVYNECGCYDEEEVTVEVGAECGLKLSCSGTVCAGKTMTYTFVGPECTDYLWDVEGGTLMEGQHQQTVTIRWGAPESGYGVVYLDGGPCECECTSRKSIRIPVISDNVLMQGPDIICPDERQEYTLPIWGSTSYSWSCTPAANTVLTDGPTPNRVYLECSQAGVYDLSVTYECPFLSCGPFTVHKQVVVKPRLSVISPVEHEVCLNSLVTFATNAATASLWKVTRNGTLLPGSPQTSVTFSQTFSTVGIYTVTAENASYCNVASFIIEVKDAPPALPLDNIEGYHQVCPNSTYQYTAIPTSGNYYIRWEWNDGTSTHIHNGDKANITFGSTLHNINVYQVDRRTGCISPATVFQITQFTPSAWPYSADFKVCEGETFDLDLVENQLPHVLYEWTVTPTNAISIQGDNLTPHISLLVNYANPSVHNVTVALKRTYCVNLTQTHTVTVKVNDIDVSVVPPNCLCTYCNNTFSIGGTTDLSHMDTSHTHWSVTGSGTNAYGATFNPKFETSGSHEVILHYVSKYGCTKDVPCTVSVQPFPNFSIALDNTPPSQQICVTGTATPGDYNFAWSTGGGGVGINCISYNSSMDDVSCTVTSTDPDICCSRTLTYHTPSQPPIPCMESNITCSTSVDCLSRVTITPTPPNSIPNPCTVTITQTDSVILCENVSHPASFWLKETGPYTACLEWVVAGQCYRACAQTGSVNELADFRVSSDCGRHLVIHDNSVYSGNRPTRTIDVYESIGGSLWTHTGNTYTLGPQTSQCTTATTFSPGLYKVTVSWGSGCSYSKTVTVHPSPQITSLNITSPMCEQTPFPFSATASGQSLTYLWNFGDGSQNYGNNIDHVYEYLQNSTNFHNVALTVTDSRGCSAISSQQVSVLQMPSFPIMIEQYPLEIPHCPGPPTTLRYNADPICSYSWYPNTDDNTAIVYVNKAGDYRVLVITTNGGCRHEALGNAEYPNGPVAKIICDPEFCLNDQVKAMGDVGNGYSYSWTGSAPTTFIPSGSASNVSFLPQSPGTYTLNLTVSESTPYGPCTATDSKTITILTPPAAPSIDFTGSHCLTDGPVAVSSNDIPLKTLLWSNGTKGVFTSFRTSGLVSAWYCDPLTGCRSYETTLTIPTPPDFDALLTGCYTMCEEDLAETMLPVYSLGVKSGSPWEWQLDHNTISAGDIPAPPYMELPLYGAGTYDLTVTDYGDGCSATSPPLVIETVPCDGEAPELQLDVTVIGVECIRENCSIYLKVTVRLCNNSSPEDVVVDKITGSVNIPVPHPHHISYMDCLDTVLFIPVTFPVQDSYTLLFMGLDNLVGQCVISTVDLSKCTNFDDCDITVLAALSYSTTYTGSTQTAFIDFALTFPATVTSVLALWSDMGQIITPPGTTGTLMLDYGRLVQMVLGDEKQICIYALCCIEEADLCVAKICFTADEIYEAWFDHPDPKSPLRIQSGEGDTMEGHRTMALSPNPTTGMVKVVDAATGAPVTDVAELTVLTMHGQTAMRAEQTGSVNIHALSAGTYMVRIKTFAGKTEYLKLTKK